MTLVWLCFHWCSVIFTRPCTLSTLSPTTGGPSLTTGGTEASFNWSAGHLWLWDIRDQQFWTAVHQLLQREPAAVLCPPHLQAWAGDSHVTMEVYVCTATAWAGDCHVTVECMDVVLSFSNLVCSHLLSYSCLQGAPNFSRNPLLRFLVHGIVNS